MNRSGCLSGCLSGYLRYVFLAHPGHASRRLRSRKRGFNAPMRRASPTCQTKLRPCCRGTYFSIPETGRGVFTNLSRSNYSSVCYGLGFPCMELHLVCERVLVLKDTRKFSFPALTDRGPVGCQERLVTRSIDPISQITNDQTLRRRLPQVEACPLL